MQILVWSCAKHWLFRRFASKWQFPRLHCLYEASYIDRPGHTIVAIGKNLAPLLAQTEMHAFGPMRHIDPVKHPTNSKHPYKSFNEKYIRLQIAECVCSWTHSCRRNSQYSCNSVESTHLTETTSPPLDNGPTSPGHCLPAAGRCCPTALVSLKPSSNLVANASSDNWGFDPEIVDLTACMHACIYLLIYRSIDLSIYRSIYRSIYLSMYLSIYLSIYLDR